MWGDHTKDVFSNYTMKFASIASRNNLFSILETTNSNLSVLRILKPNFVLCSLGIETCPYFGNGCTAQNELINVILY